MKLKYFISFFALIALLSACSDDDTMTLLDEIQVSSSYVAIDVNGGTTTITLIASDAWSFDAEEIPSWLTVSPMAGSAGQSSVSFSASGISADEDGRAAVLHLACGGKEQIINVIQGVIKATEATCAEVLAGPESKTYRVTGTITAWYGNYAQYGNMYIADETGSILIYGMADKDGKLKNYPIKSWKLELGDVITVEGPKKVYNGTVELVDVTVVKVQKWMIQVSGYDPEDATIPLEGGTVKVNLLCKSAHGISVDIPDEAKNWLGIESIVGGKEPVVTFHANANNGGDRNASVSFKTTDDEGMLYTVQATINQKGSIVAATVAEFLEAEEGDTQYRLTGVLQGLYEYNGNVRGFYIRDYTGQTLVYSPAGYTTDVAKVGDIVTVIGKRSSYNGTPQMGSAQFEELVHSVIPVNIDEFLDKEDDPNVYYMISGTIMDIANPDYGNVTLDDGTNDVYVYGTYPGWGATGDNRKFWLQTAGIEVGDKLTVIGVRYTHNGNPQLSNGIYFSHEKAQ